MMPPYRAFQLTKLLVWCIIGICSCIVEPYPTKAQGFTAPTQITVEMYALDEFGSTDITNQTLRCKSTLTETRFGCTVFSENSVFPFPFTTNPITVDIHGTMAGEYPYDTASKTYNRYLLDVVPHELGIQLGSQGNKPSAAVEAQTIAARTYAYHRVNYAITVYNSDTSQVYIPFTFDLLSISQQQRIEDAIVQHTYMSEAVSTFPIDALYGQDNPAETITGTPTLIGTVNYLRSVTDPISAAYGTVSGTANGGMSSKGASRWSFGHTSSQGPVATDDLRFPGDVNGLGDFWSVRWDDAFQILTHYYTGIHIRDANENNRIVTPTRRWVPLQLFGQETPDETRLLCKNSLRGFGVAMQNTGIFNWEADAFELSYRTDWQPVSGQAPTATSYLPPVAAGDSTTTLVTIPIPDDVAEGTYTIRLEMRKRTESGDYAWFSDDGWPGYPVNVMVVEDCSQVYLPLVQAKPSTVPSALFPD